MFFDANSVKLAGNVVRVNGVYATKSHKQFAFLTVASQADKHVTFAECIAWNDEAKKVYGLAKGQKVLLKAHLGNGFDTTEHGDKVQTLMPVVNSFKVLHYSKKSSTKQAVKNSKNSKSTKAKQTAKVTKHAKTSKKSSKKAVTTK